MPIQAPQVFNALMAGRQARQQEEYAGTRNALAQQEVQNAPIEAQQRQQMNALAIQNGQNQQSQYTKQQMQESLQKTAAAALHIAKDPNPQALLQGQYKDFAATLAKTDPNFAQYASDPKELQEYMKHVASHAQSELGVAPPQPKTPEAFTLKPGETRFGSDGKQVANVAKPEGMSEYQRARLAQEERKLKTSSADTGPLVQVAGPDGNPVYATRDEANGKPAYVARDKPAAADVKWQREIKSKQPRLLAAERRVQRLADAVASISKNKVFDGGPVDQYALGWSKQGQEVAQSKASLTSELTALTRVPGIGSQSDLETRLASLPFPSAEFAPEVNAKAVAELQAFMSDLKDVYGSAQSDIQSSEVSALLDKYAPNK